MPEAGEAHGERRVELRGHVEHQHQVQAGVDLGVVRFGLRHAPQAVDFGQQPGERAAAAQHLEHARRLVLHQPARELLPHPLGHERVDLSGFHHQPHQRGGLRCDAEIGEARRKARQPQDAHRVFGKRRRHVAQHLGLEVALAVVRVDQRAVNVACHRVDGEVAPHQVFFERDAAVGVDGEAAVARRRLALGARERHFLFRLRVQEDREVLADRRVAGGHHLVGRGAHGHPVVVVHRQPEQGIAHCAADHVGFHGRQFRCSVCATERRGSPRCLRGSRARPGRLSSRRPRSSAPAPARCSPAPPAAPAGRR